MTKHRKTLVYSNNTAIIFWLSLSIGFILGAVISLATDDARWWWVSLPFGLTALLMVAMEFWLPHYKDWRWVWGPDFTK